MPPVNVWEMASSQVKILVLVSKWLQFHAQ
jgi:hypothetical protein